MRTSIDQIAQKAGVTIPVVSKVLDNTPGVDAKTRGKILKAVEEFGFKPPLIEIFFPWISYKFRLNNPWYMNILDGVYQMAQESHFGVLINSIAGIYDPQEVFRQAFSHSVDGILVVSPYLEDKDLTSTLLDHVPIVFIGFRSDDPRIDYVDSQNIQAANQVVDHLVELGHRKIACVTGDARSSRNALDRQIGFQLAMKRHYLPTPPEYMLQGDFLMDSGETAMNRLLELPDRPTAVFCSNDYMALGALKAMKRAGVRAGKDIALVGFDDIPDASQPGIDLTTVRQAYQTLSTEAVKVLLEKIYRPEGTRPKHILIPTQLIVRGTSGPKI